MKKPLRALKKNGLKDAIYSSHRYRGDGDLGLDPGNAGSNVFSSRGMRAMYGDLYEKGLTGYRGVRRNAPEAYAKH